MKNMKIALWFNKHTAVWVVDPKLYPTSSL